MKRPLTFRLFIFVVISFFTTNTYSQALPDPGRDPIDPVDSISRSIDLKLISATPYETPVNPIDDTSGEELFKNIDNFSFYNPQEKI